MTKSLLVFVAGGHLLTCLLLILQAASGSAAPAPVPESAPIHHLTIAAEGDTPTLVVTSSELGITPEKLTQTITTTTTTVVAPTMTVPAKHYKNFAQKPKSKSTKYNKKQTQYSAKEKTIWRGKETLHVSPTTPTTPTTTAPTTPLNKELTASVTSSTPPNYDAVHATKTTAAAIDAGTDNQYRTAVIPEARTTAQQAESTSEEPSGTQTTFGNLPRETQTVTLAPTAPTDAEILKQTLEVVTSAKTLDDDDDTTVLATAISADSTASEEETPAPVITTEALLVSDETTTTTTSTTTKSAYIKSNYGDDDNVVVTHQPATAAPAAAATTTPTPESVLTVQSNGSQIEVTATETPDLTTAATVVITDNTQESETLPPPTATQSSTAEVRSEQHQPHYDGIVKLIDLEAHDLKSIGEVQEQQQQQQPCPHDDGHDGVKVTKKKQLIDRHFLADSITTSAIAPTTTTTTTTITTGSSTATAAVATTTKTDDKKVSVSHSQNVEKPTMSQPTLVPVHNGYLGPIFMEEKTFSVVHRAHPKQHEASIESQLRDGRIVEILAPTALLEQTPATPTPTTAKQGIDVSSITTTIAPPTAQRTATQRNTHNTPVLSTTVFQVSESLTRTTRLPANAKFTHKTIEAATATKQFGRAPENSEQTESKISDIQIEVYDSTVDSIVASTNFKDNDGYYSQPIEPAVGTVKPALSAVTQERFTQYVIDRTDSSTQESSIAPLHIASGKPEPAAIEIHINVSEGFGNASEDLEFSYRQSDYTGNSRPNWVNNFSSKSSKPNYFKAAQNESNATGSSERSDEILVVEIIDTGDNSTENAASSENVNPIFTFRSDIDSDVELKDIKYFPPEAVVKPPQVSDELFMVDVKKGEENFPQPPPPPPPPPRQPSIDRDSDTIFYISNTEVKVGESLPTANTNYEQQQQLRKTRLENQFFPANYLASTHPNAAKMMEPAQHRYEEDIILSPLSNTADALKIFRSPGADGAPPLDVTYVGESVMEVEQLSSASGAVGGAAGIATTFTSAAYVAPPSSQMPDVIIQPAILPEMSIGVPVIGELPPQIELKEIDFMPDEANQQRSGVYENDIEEDVNANDVDRLVESSIQYGGDLIDEGAGGAGFDGVEGSYPFGNPMAMRRKQHGGGGGGGGADYAHFNANHGVSNLRKDELSVDIATSGGSSAEAGALAAENSTLKELLQSRYGNDTSMNISYAVSERMGNATAFSVMEDPSAAGDGELGFKNLYTLIIGLFIVLLPVVVTVSMACALRYLYSKYQSSSSDNNDNTDPHQANGTAGDGGEHGESTQPPSPTKSELDKETATTTTKRYENDKTSHDITQKPSNSSSHCSIIDERLERYPTQTPFHEPAFVYKCDTMSKTQTDDQSNSVQGNCIYAGGPNGSVTKMTLKNNHLIVETEERNDISRDARETKMHYNTSDKDGIFVVEVARGVDSKGVPDSPIAMAAELPIYEMKQNGGTILKTEDEKVLKNHEEVQIHQPPPELPTSSTAEELQRSLHQIVEVEEPTPSPNSAAVERNGPNEETDLNHHSNTGLSQSDLSSTSSTDSNKRYSYGNQELYIIEQSGYATTSPTANMPLTMPTSDEAQDDDRKSENGHSLEHSPSQQQTNGPNEDNCSQLSKDNKDQQMSTNTNPNRDERQLNGYVAADNKEHELEKSEQKHNGTEEVIEQTTIETEEAVKVIPDVVLIQPPTAEEKDDAIDTKPQVIEQQTTSLGVEHELKPVENGSMNGVGAEEDQHQHQHNGDALNGIETESENAYDSIMSLPDPPSNEEITQLGDFSLIETNQLDSLPPPPPPLAPTTATATMPAVNGISEEIDLVTAPTVPLTKVIAHADEVQTALTNGIDTPKSNGHEISYNTSTLPPPPPSPTPSPKGITSNGEVLTAPLTPPASPPPHFSNGVVLNGGGICVPPQPMAVDVNGS